jgi:hypothetical protein
MTVVDVEQLVDPELEGLLRELGSRPRSVFLRSSRKDALRMLRSRTTQGVGALAVPDALERELVTVHRAELAEILKEACRTKLLEGKREKLFVMRYRTATERVDPVPMGRISEQLERAISSGIADPWTGAMSSIRSALSVRSEQELSVLDLAALGQKLQPGDTWRVMSAMSFLAKGDEGSAREMSKVVLDGWPETENALRVLEILAIMEVFDGDPERALEIQERACTLKEDYVIGQMNRLVHAIFLGQERPALDASARLDDLLEPDHPMIAETNKANLSRWRGGEGTPSAEVARFARVLESKLGHVGRRIAHVVS